MRATVVDLMFRGFPLGTVVGGLAIGRLADRSRPPSSFEPSQGIA
jgi:hypothetical protein